MILFTSTHSLARCLPLQHDPNFKCIYDTDNLTFEFTKVKKWTRLFPSVHYPSTPLLQLFFLQCFVVGNMQGHARQLSNFLTITSRASHSFHLSTFLPHRLTEIAPYNKTRLLLPSNAVEASFSPEKKGKLQWATFEVVMRQQLFQCTWNMLVFCFVWSTKKQISVKDSISH